MTNEEKYKGKMYHTESFALRNGGAGEYTYTFYYEAKDADKRLTSALSACRRVVCSRSMNLRPWQRASWASMRSC